MCINSNVKNNLRFLVINMFTGSAKYNQTYTANHSFKDYEFYRVIVGWKEVLCIRQWYADGKDALKGYTHVIQQLTILIFIHLKL